MIKRVLLQYLYLLLIDLVNVLFFKGGVCQELLVCLIIKLATTP